jgi:aminopeptidase N
MEYSGLVTISGYAYETYTGAPTDLLVSLTSHEVAHEWWYGAVGNDQVRSPWLDEALAKYSEVLYYERYAPSVVDWWWRAHIDYWDPTAPLDSTLYDFSSTATFIHELYGRGARFIRDLRALMGDEGFFAFLQDYQRQGRGRLMTTEDFFAIAGAHTDADLTPLRQSYFSGP